MLEPSWLTLPFPPSINNYYGRRVGVGVYVKKHVKDYKDLVFYTVKPKVKVFYGEHLIKLSVNIFPPDNRTHDMDNLFKCLFDVIQMLGIIDNDKQIRELFVKYSPPVKEGKLEIFIEELLA